MKETSTRRRWYQFSLRRLLLWDTPCAAVLAIYLREWLFRTPYEAKGILDLPHVIGFALTKAIACSLSVIVVLAWLGLPIAVQLFVWLWRRWKDRTPATQLKTLPTMAIPPRRSFRFALRTMFVVVTLICIWLGWQVSIVRHRRAMRAELEASGWRFSLVGDGPFFRDSIIPGERDPPHGQFIRRLMGDSEYEYIVAPPPPITKEMIEKVRAAFPSEVIITDP